MLSSAGFGTVLNFLITTNGTNLLFMTITHLLLLISSSRVLAPSQRHVDTPYVSIIGFLLIY